MRQLGKHQIGAYHDYGYAIKFTLKVLGIEFVILATVWYLLIYVW